MGTIIKTTSIAVGRESDKAAAGSTKCAPRRDASEPAPARSWQRHLYRKYKGLPKMSSDGNSILEES